MLPERWKEAMPWWAKVAAKLALSRLPVGYGTWARLNLFRHGAMDRPDRALDTFAGHHGVASSHASLPEGFAVLELGPGDSLLASVAAWGYGAGRIAAADIGAFARTDLAMLRALDSLLRARGLRPLPIEGAADAATVLGRIGLDYRTDGLAGLDRFAAATFDLIWSSAVLEHVRRDLFAPTLAALARALKPTGVMVHGIDFSDHLGGRLDNLRFAPRIWEHPLVASGGFYTNRLAPSEMMAAFRQAGLVPTVAHEQRWPEPPTPRERLHPAFRDRETSDLTTHSVTVVLRPAAG